MAKGGPCSYGGEKFKENPKTQHSKEDTTSIYQESSVFLLPEDGHTYGYYMLTATFVPFVKETMRCTRQLAKYIYPLEEDDQPTKQFKQSTPLKYKPKITKEYVNNKNNIFKILRDCYTVTNNELGLIAVEYNWPERHLRLEQGLNLLALCKNCDCENYIQGVVCPRGMFRDRNGYCPLDMELYKVKCPTCKQRITPDESFGFGFYNCYFQITYKLVKQKEYKMRQQGSDNIFYFRKLSVSWNLFEYLEAQISTCTFV